MGRTRHSPRSYTATSQERKPGLEAIDSSADSGESPAGDLQVGVLPWRRAANGEVELLLITSSRRQRWIVPKGWPIAGKSLRDSARQEAHEEAGIRGRVDDEPFGSFLIDKVGLLGDARMMTVQVYPLEVTEELDSWPENRRRQRRWFSLEEAVGVAATDSLKQLIRKFVAPTGREVR